MKVEGKFTVTDVTAPDNPVLESSGHNTFTNAGRQHVCDWLLHDNYSDDLSSPSPNAHIGIGGRSLSDMKMLPFTDVTPVRVGAHSSVETPANCLYPHNINSGNYMRLQSDQLESILDTTWNNEHGTIFFDFNRSVELHAIHFCAVETSSWNYAHKIEISTSPNTYATSSSGDWTKRKFNFVPGDMAFVGGEVGNDWRHQLMLRFDQFGWPNKTISSVKSVRMKAFYNDAYVTWGNYYGIWFLEANHYPNTPSVIAIGTGSDAPAAANTVLQTESARKFVRIHKTAGTYEVKYGIRLDSSEGNGVTYREIGLFANPTKGGFIGLANGPSVCTTMIGRGVFDTPWSKTSSQVKDVDYSLTVTP
jgi:hypothetical protein